MIYNSYGGANGSTSDSSSGYGTGRGYIWGVGNGFHHSLDNIGSGGNDTISHGILNGSGSGDGKGVGYTGYHEYISNDILNELLIN